MYVLGGVMEDGGTAKPLLVQSLVPKFWSAFFTGKRLPPYRGPGPLKLPELQGARPTEAYLSTSVLVG